MTPPRSIARSPSLLASLLLACGGPSVAPDPHTELGVVRGALATDNGGNLNGSNLNGGNLNGGNLNGGNLNGGDLNHTLISVNFAGALREGIDGNKLDEVWLVGTEFFGRQSNSLFRGLDFDQTRFVGNVGDGTQVTLRIEGLTPPAAGDDLWTYLVRYWDTEKQGWFPICITHDGTAVNAIPVAGRWDYRQGVPGEGGAKTDDPSVFTFACETAAIAKCIRIGYEPWASETLAAHHQTCTRVIRADYCGDGVSHTVDGQWVNLFDAIGVQLDTEAWYFEAEWDEAGARCFTPQNRSHAHVSCYEARKTSACGKPEHFAEGALLMTETPYKN